MNTIKPRVLELLKTHHQGMTLITSRGAATVNQQKPMLSIFEHVIGDILGNRWRLPIICNSIASLIEEFYPSLREIVACGVSHRANELVARLHQETKTEFKIIEPERIEMTTSNLDGRRTTKNPQLAIVGMAGRFPDSADHEKFWDLLNAGLDVHREVENLNIREPLLPANTFIDTWRSFRCE